MDASFHVMSKPTGPICNLDGTYCFYLEKEGLYGQPDSWAMNAEVLESYVRQYVQAQPHDVVNFAWQGGEPTLLGVNFFRKAFELQQKYANGKTIQNALQTNGVLLRGFLLPERVRFWDLSSRPSPKSVPKVCPSK